MGSDCKALREAIDGGKRLVVFLHDNPDPDAIAGGWLLAHIGEAAGLHTEIVHGGRLGRAENRALVRHLKIPLRRLDRGPRLRFLHSDRYALVDTQPGTGNNSFPHRRQRCQVVIDHHPRRKTTAADFSDIRPDRGCSASLLLGYFIDCGLELTPDLATAVAYAIISETQDLGREASRADREAYQRVISLARLAVLGRIRHPPRTREYYKTIARAMRQVMLSRNTCVCHIGAVDEAEVVAEVADFLAAMERITWCLVSGRHDGQMVLSLRSTLPQARAERVMRRMLGRAGKGGGHGMIAGGVIPLDDDEDYAEQATRVSERFLSQLPRRQPERLHPLLGKEAPPPEKACVPGET
jgi:nanoRNase/pAp phosphatase (c-di-AMP/oligoRNAs hydrolase)